VVGWLWYIGTLLPAIGLLQSGLWPAIADRFVYVPLIGLFIMISWGVADLSVWWRHRKTVLAAAATVVLLALMAKTGTQTAYWANGSMLFTQALKVTQNNSIAHNELAKTLAKQDRLDEAIDHYLEALRINPIFGDACYNLGIAFTRMGNDGDAIRYYKKGLQIKPDNAKAHNNLGSLYIRMGNIRDAVYHYHEALRVDPLHAGSYYNLGKIFNNQGKTTDAILHYRNALHLKPNMTQSLYNLSWIFATHENDKIRNGEEAVKLAEKLCKITQYNQPLALDALAAAYAEAGKFDAAVLTAQKALKLALVYGPEELALGLKKRLQLYQVGRPYHQTQPKMDNIESRENES
jgi:tetratricopeptide (TPR) repeat protein